ncbi:MAG: LysM peptidoglycan-binding domain-containing protein [Myxococcota bacterium]
MTTKHDRWFLSGVMAMALALPAAAQEGEEAPEADQPVEQTQQAGKKAPPGSQGETPPQVTEIHQVNQGDTLWDLCTKYLNSPWYWPKIWSYNPQITNPHWIFPGNELRFYPSDENLPTNVEASRMIEAPAEEENTRVYEDVVSATRSIKVGQVAKNSFSSVDVAFIDPADRKHAGEIEASFAEGFMLSLGDKLYIRFKEPARPGERLAIYRTVKEIEHPITGEPYGTVSEIVGEVRIAEVSQKINSGIVERAYRPIERGDWVAPFPESFRARVAPVPATASAKGYIIETMEAAKVAVGEHDVIFIDRGRAQGVQAGNVFTVLHRGDKFTGETEGFPLEDVGKAMVVDVRENASTAVVIRSIYELSVGDKVELRTGAL